MLRVLQRVEEGTTTVRDARALAAWLAALAVVGWVLGFITGRGGERCR